MRFCTSCGAAIDESDRFCSECGAEHAAAPDPEEEPPADESQVSTPAATPRDEPVERPPAEPAATEPEAVPSEEGLLGFALAFPSRQGFVPPVVGGILFLLFFLIVPPIIAAGYLVRLAHSAAHGEPKPPEFENWMEMLKDGVVLILVFLPILIVYVPVMAIASETNLGLYLLMLAAGSYVLPAIFVNFAAEANWKAAYDINALAELWTSSEYVVGFLIYFFLINGVGIIVVGILMLLSLLTIIGWIILWPMIFFYWYAIDASLWGRVYHRVHHP